MDVKIKFLQSVLCEMHTVAGLNGMQMDVIQQILIEHLRDIKMEQILFAVSCDVDDNTKYLKLFIAARRLEGLSEKTLRSYYFYTKRFLSTIDKNFRDVEPLDVQWYLSVYEAQYHVSRRSLDNIRRGINGVFLWLEENDFIDRNPLKKIRPIAFETKPIETLSDEDVVKLKDYVHSDIRGRAIISFLLSTGVRVSELCKIDVEDVDFVKREVLIHSAKKRSKQTRTVFLTPDACFYLKSYLEYRQNKGYVGCDALFQSNRKTGKRITERIVNTYLRKLERELGIDKKITVHIFRKTLASNLHRRGMDNTDIATYLGHSGTATSEKYYIGIKKEDLEREFHKYC